MGDFLFALNWERANLLTVFYMIAIGTMAYLTGNGFVYTLFVDSSNRFMAFETSFIGVQFNEDILLIRNISPPIVTVLSHALRDKKLPTKKRCNSDDHKRDDQFDEVGVVSGFRLLVHVMPP